MNFDKKNIVCRVCLRCDIKHAKCLSIFEKYNETYIFEKINSIVNIEIKENDGLPGKICPDCLLELETAVNFKKKCEDANIILQTTINVLDRDSKGDDSIIKEEDLTEEPEHLLDNEIDNYGYYIDVKPDMLLTESESCKLPTSVSEPIKKTRTIDLQLECDDCGGHFKSKCKLRVHMKVAHKPKIMCEMCKRIFKTYRAYHSHKKRKPKSCLLAANVHIEGEGKLRIFHCKECNYRAKRMKEMGSHLVLHTGIRAFACDICYKYFTQQSSLQCHKESVHQVFLMEGTCQYCGKHIKGRNKLYKHLRIHTTQTVQCEICLKTLKCHKSLSVHMKRHTNLKGYACEICGTQFNTSSGLCNHKRYVHSRSKFYKCDLCDYRSLKLAIIKRHKAKHTDTNIPCQVCGVFVENEQELQSHQKRHFDKKYSCPHCDRKFYSRKSSSKHIIKKHRCTMLPSVPKVSNIQKEELNENHEKKVIVESVSIKL